jgi:hypothetical protein
MVVRILSRRYSSSRRPYARRWSTRILLFSPSTTAGNQENVRAPALVRGRLLDLADVRPPVPAVDSRGQHEAVQLHHPPNALAVVARPEGAVYHRPDAAVPIRRAAVGHRADLLQHRGVRHSVISPIGTHPGHGVGRAPGDAEYRADRRHRVRRHRPDSLRNDGVFFTASCAARRISTLHGLAPQRPLKFADLRVRLT